MRRFIAVYGAFFSQQLKSLMEYKLDFSMGMLALAIQQLGSFIVLFAVFSQIQALGSYSFDEMLLFFAYSQIVKGIDHIYNDNIWTIGWWRIRDGSFSQFLTRPLGLISQIVMERVQFDGFGEFLIGLLLFIYAYIQCGLSFGVLDVLVFIYFIIFGLTIYFSIKLLTAAVSFWTVSSGELMTVAYEIGNFTRYPLDMYQNQILRTVLLYVLPFALVSWLPIVWFIRDSDFIAGILGLTWAKGILLLGLTALIAGLLLGIASLVWKRGLRRYTATGT